jgi:MFS family permease
MYIFTVVICVGVGLVNIGSFPAITGGRFIEGISIGFFSAVAPIYMREIAPK